MVRLAKVIMLRKIDRVPRLITVVAIEYDERSGMVKLTEPIDVGDGISSDQMPLALCYAYDANLLEQVNGLSESAVQKLRAAVQLLDTELRQAQFHIEMPDGSFEPAQEPHVKWH
jgi:hypothetical protein